MSARSRTYVVSEKNFLRQAGRGMWIGSIFKDHGRTMKITAIGKAYEEGQDRLIEIAAVETGEVSG